MSAAAAAVLAEILVVVENVMAGLLAVVGTALETASVDAPVVLKVHVVGVV